MGDWYVTQTIGLLPERAARQWGPREALAFQGGRWTFAQMHARVDAAAKGLLSLGIAPGDTAARWMVKRPEWIDAMLPSIKIRAVLVQRNTRFRTEDMAYILAQSDAAAVLLTDRSGSVDYCGMMREGVPALGSRPDTRFPCLRHVVVLSDRPAADVTDSREVLDRGTPVTADALRKRAARVDPEDSAFILYTSGTTGFPKGAVHNHRMIRTAGDHGDRRGLTVNDVILMSLPLFHAFGFVEGPLMSMVRGARQVLTETFDAGQCLDLIASER